MGYSAGSLEVALITTANDAVKLFSSLNIELRNTKRLVDSITKSIYGKRMTKAVKEVTGTDKKSKSGGMFGFANALKLNAIIFTARKLGTVVANIAQHGADYTETLNLWETAMGNNLATEFIDKMNKAYGISEKTLMNAQAIFKNMIGSLGQISDEMAYKLSEGITQMAIDYASLYNVTFEQAFSKFQAVLAGQVRPIRSVAGYDITETTLFQLYQSLGGQKTMRQLTRTEKQLLSILAIFHQMERSGATGDLAKTMESFANQSRVMAEAWKQLTTYAGALITFTIQESGLLTQINAVLIFIGNVLKALAEDMGAIQHFGGNIFEDVTDGANEASLAMEEVNGKLLDFDKFRALSSSQDNNIGLDQNLLNSLTKFDSILEIANSKASELAEHFGIVSGFFKEDGTFNKQRWDEMVDSIESLGRALTIIVAGGLVEKLTKSITAFSLSSKGLQNILVAGIIWAFLEFIDAIKEGDYETALLAGTIGGVLVVAWMALNAEMLKTIGIKIHKFFIQVTELLNKKTVPALIGTKQAVTGLQMAFSALALSFAIASFSAYMNSEASFGQKLVTMFVALATAITAAAIAINVFKQNWAQAVGVAGLVAGGVFTVSSALSGIDMYADGGMPDKGTMFIAGEAGAEMVYNTPSGQAGVANIQQIKQAQLQAMKEWWASAKYDIPQFQGVSESGLYQVIDGEARRRGKTFANA